MNGQFVNNFTTQARQEPFPPPNNRKPIKQAFHNYDDEENEENEEIPDISDAKITIGDIAKPLKIGEIVGSDTHQEKIIPRKRGEKKNSKQKKVFLNSFASEMKQIN